MPDIRNIEELISFTPLKIQNGLLLLTEKNPSELYSQECVNLIEHVLTIHYDLPNNHPKKFIVNKHTGGKQVLTIYECLLHNKKVAVKIYRTDISLLVIHTIAIPQILKDSLEINQILSINNLKISFPQTIAIGQSIYSDSKQAISILVQEWVDFNDVI